MNNAPESGRRTDRRRRLVVGLVLVIVVALASEFHLRNQVSPPPLPKPNGFHALIAATRIVTSGPSSLTNSTPEQLREFVETNAAALQLAQEGLQHQCRITYPFNTNYINTRMKEFNGSKSLAHLFSAASMVAANEGRFEKATDHALSAVRLGHEGFRSGVIIDGLVGNACEAIGLRQLMRLTNALAAAECRRVASALESLDANRETTEQVLENEKEWACHAGSWREKLQSMWAAKSLRPGKAAHESFVNSRIKSERRRREIILLFAARAYELEHGQPPLRAVHLVPEYLRALPQDPETGTPMELPRISK